MVKKPNLRIAVLIPSYNRPEMLRTTLQRWLKAKFVDKVCLMAEASSEDIFKRYEKVVKKYDKSNSIRYKLALGKLGSVKARNILLDMVSQYNYKYILMVDDDHYLLDESLLAMMANELELNDECGLIGGKVISGRQRVDPDFFINVTKNMADLFSKLTGYVFLDIKHGPRYSEFLPSFFMMKKEVLNKGARYDETFDTPTGFREESDFQLQIKHQGYKFIYDPRISVIHLAAEEGGNRPKIDIGERMFWKARNHAVFILKWNKSNLKRIWYIMLSILILFLYRIWHVSWVFQGIEKGIYDYKKSKMVYGCRNNNFKNEL